MELLFTQADERIKKHRILSLGWGKPKRMVREALARISHNTLFRAGFSEQTNTKPSSELYVRGF
jgi:hypothetical protein